MTTFITAASKNETILGELLEDTTIDGFNNMIKERNKRIEKTFQK